VPRFTANFDEPIRVAFDADERIARAPAEAQLKGMFFLRLTSMLREEWPRLVPTLSGPPRLGSYLPFSNYPFSDYLRLSLAAAKKQYPREPIAQALRLLERDSVKPFAESTVGKVTLRMVPDLASAMLKIPDVQKMVFGVGRIVANATGPRSVRVEFAGVPSWLDCAALGNFEGAASMYGEKTVIDVDVKSPSDAVYEIRW
jgi:uncharacterized protein (TIGR02265 family)